LKKVVVIFIPKATDICSLTRSKLKELGIHVGVIATLIEEEERPFKTEELLKEKVISLKEQNPNYISSGEGSKYLRNPKFNWKKK